MAIAPSQLHPPGDLHRSGGVRGWQCGEVQGDRVQAGSGRLCVLVPTTRCGRGGELYTVGQCQAGSADQTADQQEYGRKARL